MGFEDIGGPGFYIFPTAAILCRSLEGGKSDLSLSENMESKIDGD
jgi:hypothetical protein